MRRRLPEPVYDVFFDRMGYLRGSWMVLLAAVALAGLFAVLWFGGAYLFDKPGCEKRAAGLGTEARYVMPQAYCQFRLPDGRWIDSDVYRVVVK